MALKLDGHQTTTPMAVLSYAIVVSATFVFGQFYTPPVASPLGGAVVTQTEPISKDGLSKPEYLKTYTDPYFGSKITRVTGDPGTPIPNIGGTWPQNCRNHYQKDPPWNADGSILYLTKGCRMFLDGQSYEPLFTDRPPGVARFHPTAPDLMIYLSGNTIGKWNIRTKQSTVIETFAGYSDFEFMSEGNISGNGRWIAPTATKDGKKVTFAYDMVDKKKYPDIDLSACTSIDWVSICYSGKYVVANAGYDANLGRGFDQTQIYDSKTGTKVGPLWGTYGHPSHYDLGIDNNGDDVAVGVAKSDPNKGQCIMRRLKDGTERPLMPAGSHTGTRNSNRPGWAYIQSPRDIYEHEIVAVQLIWTGNPVVERLGYIPSVTIDYISETFGAVSFDGTRFCAGTNWGNSGGPVQAYVVDVRHLLPSTESTQEYRGASFSSGLQVVQTSHKLCVRFPQRQTGEMSIISLEGKTLFSHHIDDAGEYALSTDSFTFGVHIVRLLLGKTQLQKKVIVGK